MMGPARAGMIRRRDSLTTGDHVKFVVPARLRRRASNGGGRARTGRIGIPPRRRYRRGVRLWRVVSVR